MTTQVHQFSIRLSQAVDSLRALMNDAEDESTKRRLKFKGETVEAVRLAWANLIDPTTWPGPIPVDAVFLTLHDLITQQSDPTQRGQRVCSAHDIGRRQGYALVADYLAPIITDINQRQKDKRISDDTAANHQKHTPNLP